MPLLTDAARLAALERGFVFLAHCLPAIQRNCVESWLLSEAMDVDAERTGDPIELLATSAALAGALQRLHDALHIPQQ